MGVILLLLIIVFSFSKEAYYCIQVLSSRDLSSAERAYRKLADYPHARIEKIGDYYTVRVGLWENKSKAKEYLSQVKSVYPGAFLRTCYYIEDRIVSINKGNVKKKVESFNGKELVLHGKNEKELICKAVKKVFEDIVSFEGKLTKREITFKSYFPYSVADAVNYALILNKKEGFIPVRCRVYKRDKITYVLELEGFKNGKVKGIKAVDYASVTYRNKVLRLKLIF
ncbi:SPOR domain-containing protein [Aquifex aeolicus]|uniref:SPOR domain-containing protein n=1 Tax=Aquifex aeolicus (strain VF5) TaxID=224324 RepID=O67405_AQUAE|nr:SPOR domain-containing protein [Aquifex aeolicus]AAC07366.1 putative protein [Aquifex aeolicus VF5]